MRRGGFTMLEAVMVCLIGAVVLGGAVMLMVNSGKWGERGTNQALALADVRLALAEMTREVREARQVLYPAAGRKPQAALGLMTATGEAVFFRLVKTGQSQALVRETVKDGKQAPVISGVSTLVVSVADPGGGREPSLVRILVGKGSGSVEAPDAGVTLFTSASCRGVLTRCLALREPEP